jgi:hypothetical protein
MYRRNIIGWLPVFVCFFAVYVTFAPFLSTKYTSFSIYFDYFKFTMYFVIIFIFCNYAIKEAVRPHKEFLLFGLFVFLCLTGGVLGGNGIALIFKSLWIDIKFPALFLAISMMRINRKEYFRLLVIVFAVIFIQFFIGLIQFLGGFEVKAYFMSTVLINMSEYKQIDSVSNGAIGTLLSKNAFGQLMYLVLLMTEYNLLNRLFVSKKFLRMGAFLGIFISGSRTVWLLTFLFFLFTSNNKIKFLKYSSVVGAGFVSLLICYSFVSDAGAGLLDRASEIFTIDYYAHNVIHGRLAYFLATCVLVFKGNILFGLGAGNWGMGLLFNSGVDLTGRYFTLEPFFFLYGVLQDTFYPHMLGQYGALAFAVYMFMHISIFRSLNNMRSIFPDVVCFGRTLIFSSFLIGMTCCVWSTSVFGFLYWFLLGITFAVLRTEEKALRQLSERPFPTFR